MLRFTIFSGKPINISQRFTYGFGVIALGLVFGLSIQFVHAWTNPSTTPPSGNLAGPLNTSALTQTKAGQLNITGGGKYGTGGIVIGGHSFNSSGAWLDLGNSSLLVYGNTGLDAEFLWANSILYTRLISDIDPGGYTLDPSGTSVVNTLTAAYGHFTGFGTDTWFPNPNGWNYIRGNTIFSGTLFDEDNSGYYLNPASTSNTFEFYRAYGFNGPERDGNNGNYYVDPSAATNLDTLCIRGVCNTSWPSATEADTLQTVTDRGNTTTRQLNITGGGKYGTGGVVIGSHSLNSNGGWLDLGDSSLLVGGNKGFDADFLWAEKVLYIRKIQDVDAGSAYYLDPSGISLTNELYRAKGFNGPELDVNNETYYVDPSGTSNFNGIYANLFYYSSDETLKKNIETIPHSLESVQQLRGVTFNWKENNAPNIGLIAQEVEKVYPELVNTDKKTGLKSVEYGNLVGPIIEAIKELNQKVQGVLTKNDTFEKQLQEQTVKIEEQQRAIEELKKEIEILKQQ